MMNKRRGIFFVFSIFFLISLLLFILYRQPGVKNNLSFLDPVFVPIQRSVYGAFSGIIRRGDSSEIEKLRAENRRLQTLTVTSIEAKREMEALKDQFQKTKVSPSRLLPAKVIGTKSFIPGVSLPDGLILDKGSSNGLKINQTVIVGDNVVGRVVEVFHSRSRVDLLINKGQVITAASLKTGAIGVIRGQQDTMLLFDGVLLSEKLENGDLVITKGEVSEKGLGYPPDLIIGKITSVNRKASNLFQSAGVESLIDFTKLTNVFVITRDE